MTTVEVPIPEVVTDGAAVLETAQKVNLLTPKRLVVTGALIIGTIAAVVVVKKVKARRALVEMENEEA